MKFKAFLVGVAMALTSLPSVAAISLALAANYDATRTTAFPSGDKPVAGCTPPTGWTEVSLGDAGGEICEQSASEFDLSVSGTHHISDSHLVYKDAGASDVQLIARITNTFAGSTENFASAGIQIRESAADTGWAASCHSLQNGATAIQFIYGADGTYSQVNGAAGQSRPRYVTLTFDDSSGDIKCHASADGVTYTEVGSTNRNLSDALGAVFGQSKSITESLQATIDNIALSSTITVYTPVDPDPDPVPVLVTPIENQSLAQGVAFSLSCSANFTGATSYTQSGLPAGTGLTFNTSTCAFGGTPDADDVTASPFNVTVSGVNSFGSTPTVSQFTVSGVPGNTIAITAGMTGTLDCDTLESGGRVDPGDILQIAGGTRGVLELRDCHGTPTAPIIIRNDVTDNEPAIIESSGSPNAIFNCESCSDVLVDGSGKYVGAPAGTLGVTLNGDGTRTEGRTQAGIIVRRTTDGGRPTFYIRYNGLSRAMTTRGVLTDGRNHTGSGNGICFSIGDHTELAVDNPGVVRDNIVYENNYANFCGKSGGEAFYIGPNPNKGDIPLEDVTIDYNLIDTPARDCINVKSVYGGTNSVSFNHMYGCGQSGETSQNGAINMQTNANWTFEGNYAVGVGGTCFQLNHMNDALVTAATKTVIVQNNIFADCGTTAGSDGHGFRATRNSAASQVTLTVRNNTLAGTSVNGADCASQITGETVVNNILAGVGGTAVSGCDNSNNRTGSVASQNFVNSGADDYHLTSTSGACNNATSTSPDTDFDGQARPQDSADDQGADESASCP